MKRDTRAPIPTIPITSNPSPLTVATAPPTQGLPLHVHGRHRGFGEPPTNVRYGEVNESRNTLASAESTWLGDPVTEIEYMRWPRNTVRKTYTTSPTAMRSSRAD